MLRYFFCWSAVLISVGWAPFAIMILEYVGPTLQALNAVGKRGLEAS